MKNKIQIFKVVIISTIIFIVSIYIAFYLEEYYRKTIRFLFTYFNSNVSFNHPRKYYHFASGAFVTTFGIFNVILFIALNKLNVKRKIINLFLLLLILVISTITFCYFNSLFKVIECTACDDGKVKLTYDSVNYDLIFITSLLLSSTPILISSILHWKKNKLRKVFP